MSYEYLKEKPYVFTEEGSRRVIAVLKGASKCLAMSGAVRLQELMRYTGSGDSWSNIACIDRLVELGELREIPTNGPGQHRIFVSAHNE